MKRIIRPSTLEAVRQWLLASRPSGADVVLDGTYYVLLDQGRRVAAVALRRLSWFATEVRHLVVSPEERRKGYGRETLRLALERVTTPLVVATVREDLDFWRAENVRQGFSDVATFPNGGSPIHFLVRRAASQDAAAERTNDHGEAESRPA